MIELSNLLKDATAAIENGYFRLSIDGGDPVYRERVYCYELYHQMRLLWPKKTPFYLNGEVDKAAHPILKKLGADYAKPDLLIHQPGYMTGNHAVIEVKAPGVCRDAMQGDLKKLSLFKRKVCYQRAIYLIYGEKSLADAKKIKRIADAELELEEIELWLHQKAGESAVHYCQLGKAAGSSRPK